MTEVFLFNRGLVIIPMGVLTNTNTELLNLGYNNLVYLPNEFGKYLPNLKQLMLNNNNLMILPGDFGKYLPELEALFLHKNHLKSVPVNFNKLKNLKKLHLYENRLNNTTNFSKNLPNLRELYLSKNILTSLPFDFGENMPNLKNLYLDNNQLTSLPAEFGKNLPRLRLLNLSFNQLTSLPVDFVKNLPNLEKLYINNNPLTYLPDDLFSLRKLTWVSITTDENEIDNLSNIIQLINQKDFYVDYNKIKDLLKDFYNPPMNTYKNILSMTNNKDVYKLLILANSPNMTQQDKNGDNILSSIIKSDISLNTKLTIINIIINPPLLQDIITQQNMWGKTPLHYAVIVDDLDIVKLLLTYHANPNILDYNNKPPLYYSKNKEITTILKYITSKQITYEPSITKINPVYITSYRLQIPEIQKGVQIEKYNPSKQFLTEQTFYIQNLDRVDKEILQFYSYQGDRLMNAYLRNSLNKIEAKKR